MSSSDENSDFLKYRNIKFTTREISNSNSEDNETNRDSNVFQNGSTNNDSDLSRATNTRSIDNKFYYVDAMLFKGPVDSDDEDEKTESQAHVTHAEELPDIWKPQQTEPEEPQTSFGSQPNISTITALSDNALQHEDGLMSSRPKVKQIEEDKGISLVQVSKVYNRRALLKTATTYELESFEKNAMLIFNQENCNGYWPRHGTRKDGSDLSTTFGKFGFEVEETFDLNKKEIFQKLKMFSEQDFTDYGCVAVVFLTHGSDQGSLRAKDKLFYETDIINYFKKSDKPTLITKPILIIIQACRGKKMSEAVRAGEPEDRIQMDTDEMVPYNLPVESDIMVLHSTYAGRLAIRHELNGSWFIQTLCNKINELSETHDFDAIMTAVKREVAIDMEIEEYNRATGQIDIYKQMPTVQTTLTRKLFLRKYAKIPAQTAEVSKEVGGGIAKSPVMFPFAPCACRLDIFDYLKACMSHFVEDNPNDERARSYLELAEEFTDSQEFHEAKKKMATLFRNHLKYEAKNCHYYKFLYFFKDHEVNK